MTSDSRSSVVMIVDDNPNNLKVLGSMLQQAGYKVRPALSGEMALRSLQTGLPDVVLLDIRMPVMDGYEVCRRMQADPTLRDVPVIFISALQDMEDKVHAFQAGGVDYIVKPFQLEEVLMRVRTHLDLAQARRELRSINADLERRVAERTRELEASNDKICFSMQEEHVLGELLKLGLQHTSAVKFLEAALDELDSRVEWGVQKTSASLLLNADSRLIKQLGLAPDEKSPRLRFVDAASFKAGQDGVCPLPEAHCKTPCPHSHAAKEGGLPCFVMSIEAEGEPVGLLVHHVPASNVVPERWTEFLSRVTDVLSLGLERRLSDDRIEYMAYHDELTGLPNRRLLSDRLNLELALAQRSGTIGAVLFLDLDRFKTINDALGHAVGDLYLREVGHLFAATLRTEDTLSRWGGDEFLVLLPSIASTPEAAALRAQAVAANLAAKLTNSISVSGHDLQLDVSIGITLFPLDGATSEEQLSHADTAMYQAKQTGRNSICFYEARMQTLAENRLRLEKDLRSALERQEFMLHYQPQTNAAGHLRGCEALVRWNHPQRGLVSPAEFIPTAEDSGLIVPLGAWVLRNALEQQVRWLSDPALARSLRMVSVNVSSRQFHQADFIAQVEAALADTGADPQTLELEVTESMLLVDVDDTIAKMTRLKALGIRFAIDDFGTGYSSLAYLKRLPIDRLKIDQSFVRDVHKDHQDAAIVGSIISMAQHLQIGVIAEGVETDAEWVFMRAAGCPAFQGYLFGRPMPAEDIGKLALASMQPSPQ
jgi:diguanylate cyclase (GGDEF)-like protein